MLRVAPGGSVRGGTAEGAIAEGAIAGGVTIGATEVVRPATCGCSWSAGGFAGSGFTTAGGTESDRSAIRGAGAGAPGFHRSQPPAIPTTSNSTGAAIAQTGTRCAGRGGGA
jgi:hypothetical protein